MNAKEKALSLIKSYQNVEFDVNGTNEFDEPNLRNMGFKRCKQCSLIAVDEIIDIAERISDNETNFFRLSGTNNYGNSQYELTYWQEVKNELNKL